VIAGKTLVTWVVLRMLGQTAWHALAAALCLAQIGEFSFVLAAVAGRQGVITDEAFMLIVSATIATLFVTPYLIAAGPRLGAMAARRTPGGGAGGGGSGDEPPEGHVVLIGFGPAGQAAVGWLSGQEPPVHVIDLNPRAPDVASTHGFTVHQGDATRAEVLEHVHIDRAAVVVITLPDPDAVRSVILLVRSLAPNTPIIVRSRYHIHRWELTMAGAEVVIDEEMHVGLRLAAELRKRLRAG
jgi:CPA2 family monovalent cation:H+ antiporter-2